LEEVGRLGWKETGYRLCSRKQAGYCGNKQAGASVEGSRQINVERSRLGDKEKEPGRLMRQ
jgi:hypothetical protein